MAEVQTLPSLLATLTDSLTTAASSLPDPTSLTPPSDGISLLDTKNELLLSYLQNLVFLIILKLRVVNDSSDENDGVQLHKDVTKNLVELRIYLEKGVRPLEGKLKYQVDKLLTVATEADATKPNGKTKPDRAAPRPSNGAQESDSDSDSDIPEAVPAISELSHRPNPSAFVRPSQKSHNEREDKDAIYKPPRITPTALPTTTRAAERTKRPRRSQAVDAFIREEMGDAPVAEPSIGAGSRLRGKEREKEDERREYEEQRLVRLPGEKKRKERRIGGGGDDLEVNGGLGVFGDVDFGDTKGRRRKRGGDGGLGGRMGEAWERRVQRGTKRKRR